MTVSAPTINSITDGGNQASVIANVTGTGTVQLYYRLRGASAWTAGLTKLSSLLFDGVSGRVTVPADTIFDITTSCTISILFYAEPQSFGVLFDRWDNNIEAPHGYDIPVSIVGENGIMLLDMSSISLSCAFTGTGWKRITFVINNTVGKIYLDAVQIGDDINLAGLLNGNPNIPICIGAQSREQNSTFINFFKGRLGSLLFIHTALSSVGITSLVNGGERLILTDESSLFDDSDGWYMNFNEGTGNPTGRKIVSGSGSSLNGTIDGGVTWQSTENIIQTGLEPGWYEFYATDTVDGETSPPSAIVTSRVLPSYPVSASTIPSIAAKNNLMEMLARSETFQTAIAATGTTAEKIAAAKLKIFMTAYVSDNMARPFAVICKNETDKHSAIGGGESQQFLPSGGLEVRLERAVPDEFLADLEGNTKGNIEEGSEGEAEQDFEEFYQGVLADINSLAGQEGYLFIRNWDVLEGPNLFESSDEQQNVFAIKLLANWGIE